MDVYDLEQVTLKTGLFSEVVRLSLKVPMSMKSPVLRRIFYLYISSGPVWVRSPLQDL